jgi:triacylglycerol lipase
MLESLHPDVRPAIEAFARLPLNTENLAAVRATPFPPVPVCDEVEVRDHVIDKTTGLRVQSYRPAGVDGSLPCVYHIHGGGYVRGTHAIGSTRVYQWISSLPCVYVSVDYRLAPETPFPGPLEDCYEGLSWLHQHADELGVDNSRIGVNGISAGGGLAAALTLLVRDRGELSLAFQALECPMLDDRQCTPSSQQDGLPIWSRSDNEFGWRAYLGTLYGSPDLPYVAAPARATDLSGLPPSYLAVGTVDGFRDEVIDYATRLSQAGVPTDLRVYAGAPHGLQIAIGTSLADRWASDLEMWLAQQMSS